MLFFFLLCFCSDYCSCYVPQSRAKRLQIHLQDVKILARSSRLKLREDDDFDEEFNQRIDSKLRERFPKIRGEDRNRKDSRVRFDTGNVEGEEERPNRAFFSGLKNREGLTRAVAAGLFIGGIGAGIAIDSAINTNPKVNKCRRDIEKLRVE